MEFLSPEDLRMFLTENYLSFLMLGGLMIVMFAYRNVRLPAARNFQLIILVLLLMNISGSMERWAVFSPDRIQVRIAASVVHYILQPFVIWLELIIVMPDTANRRRRTWPLSPPIICNTIIYLIAPFAGRLVFYYDENYWFHAGPLGYTIYAVTFFYLALLIFWSFRFLQENDRRKGIILLFTITIAILTAILEALNLVPGYIDEAFTFGVFLYYMYLITVHETQLQTQLARQELELSSSKVKLLREQIQPHFIFNSLHVIKSLIRTDQAKALQGVEDFSDYLQANLDAITSDTLIPFEDELAHIEAYVSLALAGGKKDIRMVYDTEELYFRVPPLSIEPLVENAIRHGVLNGGTVTLSTHSTADSYVITVTDDGVGMNDSGTEIEQRRLGIGLENSRTRLATLCRGTMQIESGPEGTTVTVCLPKEKTDESSDRG